MESQLKMGVGIFACDAFQVFSSLPVNLAKGIWTRSLSHFASLSHTPGALTADWLNVAPFMEAWDNVFRDPRSKQRDWIVKVDPDTVFFPDQLELQLQRLPKNLRTLPGDRGLYIKNCQAEGDLQLYGSIEVLSFSALRSYASRGTRCNFETTSKMGEDLWMQTCLDTLNVTSFLQPDVLRDGYCPVPAYFDPSNCRPGHAAYHPRKTVTQWWQCHDQVDGGDEASRQH